MRNQKNMQLSLYNTLTGRKEIFRPLDHNLVKMYVCGPTVYDYPHIGNARSAVIYDVLYRILTHIFGFDQVSYVRNITDVDDKIINRAKEVGIKISDLTEKTIIDFHNDMKYLGCKNPNIEPKATAHIDDMIQIIERLIAFKCAYVSNNHVYFNISSSKDYTKLSGRSLEEMIEGVRIEPSEFKNHPGDFVLWKPAKPDENLSANFDSPWGLGRPGWHIECSAMSHRYLGENFDIHGGGADLIFPHHTNEIAQSQCAFPGSKFAQSWVHNGFLTVRGEKMSKSLGNFITVKDLANKNTPGDVTRLLLVSTHYRKPLDFNDKALDDSLKTINYWYRSIEGLELEAHDTDLPADFLSALLDDMNTPLAIKIINDYAKSIFKASSKKEKIIIASRLLCSARFIGLMAEPIAKWFSPEIDEELISKSIALRKEAKINKNWSLADKIRSDLLELGIVLEDKQDGSTTWKKDLEKNKEKVTK